MGNLFGGSTKQTQTSQTDTGPSKFQQPYLSGAFDAAKGIYDSSAGTPFYDGQLYAGMSEEAKASLQKLKEYASTTGMGTAAQLSSIGSSLAGYADKAAGAVDQFASAANEDATSANIKAATEYANNPQLDAMIDANSRDVVRNLNEQTLPTLNRVASGTGNINSSRAGVAEGIARRGAEDRVADISASLRGDAYNRGLTLAQADRGQRLDALGSAASAYGNLAGTGFNALKAGADAGYGAFGQITGANMAEQQDRQGEADADFAKWQGEDTRQQDLLERYFRIIGGNQWGQSGTSSGTTTTKQNQGLLTGLAGIATTGLGLAGGLGWKPFN